MNRIPVYVTNLFMAVASNKYVFLILINLLLIIVGMFMEVGATNLILGPILAPIAASFGIDPVHFGLVFVFLLALGQATPPFGTTMFVACGISKVSMADIAKQLLPFIAVEILCGLQFSFVPVLSTWIPGFWRKLSGPGTHLCCKTKAMACRFRQAMAFSLLRAAIGTSPAPPHSRQFPAGASFSR